MVKNLLFILLTIYATYTFSQTPDNTAIIAKKNYLSKSKKQKTAAKIMLIGGTAAAVTGVAVALSGGLDHATGSPTADNNQTLADVLAISGSAAILGSIPLFIAANKNKKKATSLSVTGQQVSLIFKNDMVYKTVPSLTLKIGL